jgi:hypothetical protein
MLLPPDVCTKHDADAGPRDPVQAQRAYGLQETIRKHNIWHGRNQRLPGTCLITRLENNHSLATPDAADE